jgi:acetylglutamate kinase
VIPHLNPSSYEQMKLQKTIYAGMIPKLDNAFAALNKGVTKVIIGKADHLQDLVAGKKGTLITNGHVSA